MAIASIDTPKLQHWPLLVSGAVGIVIFAHLFEKSATKGWLFLIGMFAGLALYHAAFGFAGSYRNAIVRKDMSGIVAQIVMLILAMSLFAPILAEGRVFGHGAGGSVAPISVALAVGAFIFGVGMQLGGACASGTLFSVGGGSARMLVTLAFFCLGSWWGTLDVPWWRTLPSMGPVSLGVRMGFGPAVLLQIVVLLALAAVLWRLGLRIQRPLLPTGPDNRWSWRMLLRGPWPLLWGGIALALVNWAILAVAGHSWGISWGFTLWGAKFMALTGWNPAETAYWSQTWRLKALAAPFLSDHTTISNIGIVLGAATAAALGGKIRRPSPIPVRALLTAVIGGLMMGYGARLAYGCNIGAFFSGVASTSLHGWAWIVMAFAGTVVGVRLRSMFEPNG
ncbi:MAG: YeeE/YedE family protein [Rhodospirillaceae bacterium]|nr:YeeE/YedE family protein [Rhodospirillaceae bacterium]